MPHNVTTLYFRLPYFHVSKSALFLHSTLAFYIDVVLAHSIAWLFNCMSQGLPIWIFRHRCESHLGHKDVIKWKHFPRYWPFVRGIHRTSVIFLTKPVTWSFDVLSICAWINGWVNNREAGDLRRHHAHYKAIVMVYNHHWFPARWDLSFLWWPPANYIIIVFGSNLVCIFYTVIFLKCNYLPTLMVRFMRPIWGPMLAPCILLSRYIPTYDLLYDIKCYRCQSYATSICTKF